MKVKTSDLKGKPLDWAVAIAEYGKCRIYEKEIYISNWLGIYRIYFSPSVKWDQCGPLIDKYELNLVGCDGDWSCVKTWIGPEIYEHYPDGDTPQIAICRAIVASVLGDEVDIPDELIGA